MTSSSTSSGSSSAVSWSVLKSDTDNQAGMAGPSGGPATANLGYMDLDCVDEMENLGYMDLIDAGDPWDPSWIIQNENVAEFQQAQPEQQQQEEQYMINVVDEPKPMNEMGSMFLEWLKTNKEYLSAEDMRSIKIKKSTIESAAKRLGPSPEGKKQLLKLILEWVEQYRLQKKKTSQFPFQNTQNQMCVLPTDPNVCFSPAACLPRPYVADPVAAAPPYVADPYLSYQPQAEYQTHMLDSAQTWPPSQSVAPMVPPYSGYPTNTNICNNNNFAGGYVEYGEQVPYQYHNGSGTEKLGSSATKEARKKRMARQKRFLSHRHHQGTNQSNNKEAETLLPDLESRDGIPISMEDVGTSRVRNVGYRYPSFKQ